MKYNPVQTNQRPWREKVAQRIWEMVRLFAWRLSPWFARWWRVAWLRFSSQWYGHGGGGGIAWNASVARTARIDYPWNFSIGSQSSVGLQTWVYCLDKISIGKRCCVGEDVRLLTGSHDVHSPHFDLVTKPIRIMDNVWIATGATVLPGVTVSEGAVVAAGAVVTKDVPPWTVVAGNPAKVVKRREIV